MSTSTPRRDCPTARDIKPLPDTWDVVTVVKALHRHVTELAACVNDLQRQLDALQAPEHPTKRPRPPD